jgi:hypothetical protein
VGHRQSRGADQVTRAAGPSARPALGAQRVLSERDVRAIIDQARIRAEEAWEVSVVAKNRLHVLKSAAREAATRLEKLRNGGGAAEDFRRPL